jgi:hypothetical protein
VAEPGAEAERDDAGVGEAADVPLGGPGTGGPEPGGEQQLPALQERRRVGQLAHVHPADGAVDRRPPGVQPQAERRVGEQLGDGDGHGSTSATDDSDRRAGVDTNPSGTRRSGQ